MSISSLIISLGFNFEKNHFFYKTQLNVEIFLMRLNFKFVLNFFPTESRLLMLDKKKPQLIDLLIFL